MQGEQAQERKYTDEDMPLPPLEEVKAHSWDRLDDEPEDIPVAGAEHFQPERTYTAFDELD